VAWAITAASNWSTVYSTASSRRSRAVDSSAAVGAPLGEDLLALCVDLLAGVLESGLGFGRRLLLGLGADLVGARPRLGEALVGVRFRLRDDLVRLCFSRFVSRFDPVEHLWSRHTTDRLNVHERRIRCLRNRVTVAMLAVSPG